MRKKGYREFLPLYNCRRYWGDRIGYVELPLFPSYVFCNMDLGDKRSLILTTPGVLEIVGFGSNPVPIDNSEIEAIQRVIESGKAAEPWEYHNVGSRVRITHGPLAGLEGILVEVKKQDGLVLSVSLLQRSVVVRIDSAYAIPAPQSGRVTTATSEKVNASAV